MFLSKFIVSSLLAFSFTAQGQIITSPAPSREDVLNFIYSAKADYKKSLSDGRSITVVPGDTFLTTTLPAGQHSAVVPEFTADNNLKFNLLFDEEVLKNPRLVIPDLVMFSILESNSTFVANKAFDLTLSGELRDDLAHRESIAELLFNVRAGSKSAQLRWTELKAEALTNYGINDQARKKMKLPENIDEVLFDELELKADDLHDLAKKHASTQKRKLENWKKETGLLDKLEAQEEKLNDLVLKNDRAGVRRLLQAYLPWALMEPTEARAWETWLEAIEHPNATDTVVAARGVDYQTDKVQRLKKGATETLGFFSTVLTKNQGNYTRRLRSLTTNREKNGDIVKMDTEGPKPIKIMDQFTTHSEDPVGSSFLSFSTNLEVVRRFIGEIDYTAGKSGGGLLIVNIDRRRIVPNLAANFAEREFLVPLIVFPDEVVLYQEGELMADEAIRDLVLKKTGKKLTHDSVHFQNEYLPHGVQFLRDITGPRANQCSKLFL